MSSPAPFEPIADLLERSLSICHVYGEPVRRGDTIVIPVAQVAYGFGAGGGQGRRRARTGEAAEGTGDAPGDALGDGTRPEAKGAGGGGGVRMTPVGALEIGQEGTRFIRFNPLQPWLLGAAFGFAIGALLALRRR